MSQTTVNRAVSCYGIGVHSGRMVQLTLKPAKKNTGITFIRTDVSEDNAIRATWDNVIEAELCTSVANSTTKVSTIEHLMAAICGCGIDNVIAEVNGPEVPIMDGSSKAFVFMIECAGLKFLNAPRKNVKLLKSVMVQQAGSIVEVNPSKELRIDLSIDFPNKVIGFQSISFNAASSFKEEIASARTFGFIGDLELLQSKGLAKGASLDNAIGIEGERILNREKLRFKDEFARHKLLDALGDFYIAGAPIAGHFVCDKPSHYLNNLLIRKVFSDTANYSIS